jgi:hypothetical protein
MSKTKRFEIYSEEPRGSTFEDGKQAYDHLAGPKNKKRAARFGVENDEPSDITFEDPPESHIKFPKADEAPLLGLKVIAESGGQGKYNPPENARKGCDEFPGIPGIGKSAPKHGKMRVKQGFKP